MTNHRFAVCIGNDFTFPLAPIAGKELHKSNVKTYLGLKD